MFKEPINRATPADESEPVVLPNHWQTRIRAISEWARRNQLAIIFIAAALSATFDVFRLSVDKHQSKNHRPPEPK